MKQNEERAKIEKGNLNVIKGQQVPKHGGWIILNGERIELDKLDWKKQENIEYVVYKQGEAYLFWRYLAEALNEK